MEDDERLARFTTHYFESHGVVVSLVGRGDLRRSGPVATRTRQLIDNAHEYTPQPDRHIALGVRARDGQVCFEVSDHGIGIAREDQSRVFRPFFRVDRSRSRKTGGVGLGLALARRIVEAHGGTISLESEPGAGSRVRMLLPAAPPENAPGSPRE